MTPTVDNQRRVDQTTADAIAEALRMQSTSGRDKALLFLCQHGFNMQLAESVLATRYDRTPVVV